MRGNSKYWLFIQIWSFFIVFSLIFSVSYCKTQVWENKIPILQFCVNLLALLTYFWLLFNLLRIIFVVASEKKNLLCKCKLSAGCQFIEITIDELIIGKTLQEKALIGIFSTSTFMYQTYNTFSLNEMEWCRKSRLPKKNIWKSLFMHF